MERVIDLKWDTPANALDLEMLKAQVKNHDKDVKSKLAQIEKSIATVQEHIQPGRDAAAPRDFPPPAAATPAAAPPPSNRARPPEDTAANNGSSRGPPEWLREVPTELLFHVLKTRSPPHD